MMAEAENRDEAVDIGPEAAQILTLLSGSFASGFDVAAASVAINRREERWLDARGVDDVAVRAALETRTARAHAHADKLLTTLARASATPVPDKGAMREQQDAFGEEWIRMFSRDLSARDLSEAVRWVRTTVRAAPPDLSGLDWESLARRTYGVYRALLAAADGQRVYRPGPEPVPGMQSPGRADCQRPRERYRE